MAERGNSHTALFDGVMAWKCAIMKIAFFGGIAVETRSHFMQIIVEIMT